MDFLSKMVGGRLAMTAVMLVGVLTMTGCATAPSSSNNVTATPAFSPAGGTYNASQTVTISDATAAAVLYCTTDGTTPTTSSPVCAEPTTVAKTEFLQAIAIAPGGVASAVAGGAYTIDLSAAATPTFMPAGGSYSTTQTVTISDATPGINIYYTTDGTVPTSTITGTTSSKLYVSPITVGNNETLTAIAIGPGFGNSGIASTAYVIGQGGGGGGLPNAATPVFSPAGGAVSSGQAVTISDTTPGATIYYTTNGTVPTASSTRYSGPITVGQAETISAIALASGFANSSVGSAVFTIGSTGTTPPVISPGSGAVAAGTSVTITDATSGASIYYTTNGSQPSASSTLYTGVITVNQAETITAIAIASGVSSSATSASYTITQTVTPPMISPASGAVAAGTPVTITDATSGASIYYTTNGNVPSASSTPYTGAIIVNQAETITAIAILSSNSSTIASAVYTINAAATVPPVFTPGSGSIVSGASVAITDATPGASIYYTTNGSVPSASSTLYTGPISVSQAETITAIAILSGNSSTVVSASYTIGTTNTTPPVFTPGAGGVAAGTPVGITDTTSGASIYYTLDGSSPSASSTLYSAPIVVNQAETITAIAIASGTSSAVSSASYTISSSPTPAPLFSLFGGAVPAATNLTLTDLDAKATIYYTMDGSQPSASSAKYANGITISKAATINAIAIDAGISSTLATATYTVSSTVLGPPVITPGTSTILYNVSATNQVAPVEIVGSGSLYYTLDGTTPTAASTPFPSNSTLQITQAETLNVIAIDSSGLSGDSVVATATYTLGEIAPQIYAGSFNNPTIASGTFIAIYALDPNAAIYYTLDGSTPTTNSTLYDSTGNGIPAITGTMTINAIAVGGGYTSDVTTASYSVYAAGTLPPPSFTPPAGTYSSVQYVTLMDPTQGGNSIYYTLDGTMPTTSSNNYTATYQPIKVSQTTTITAIMVGSVTSPAASATYTIDFGPAPTPTFSAGTGSYVTAQSVTISESKTGVPIYYTLDGSNPSATNGTLYSGPLAISTTTTIKATAVGGGYDASSVATVTLTIASGPLALTGSVFSGTNVPIVGAQVQAYGAGQGGYAPAGTASPLAALSPTTGMTDNTGHFSLTINCPAAPNDLVYLVATGNGGVKLMTALGSCNSFNFTAPIMLNEVTTVASAYALSPFMSSAASVSSSSTNYVGLANAFMTASNIVDITAGTAFNITPAYRGNAVPYLNNSTVPQARINTLANMLNACVGANGTGTSCDSLFAAATPPSGAAPTDTLQAILDIAQNPGSNSVSALYTLAATSPTFQPSLGASPNDWTLALTFTGGGLGIAPGTTVNTPRGTGNGPIGNTAMAIDGAGNIWVSAFNSFDIADSGMIAEFNSLGAPLTAATTLSTDSIPVPSFGGYTASNTLEGPTAMVFDPSGNGWVGNSSAYAYTEISPTLSLLQNLPGNQNLLGGLLAINGTGLLYQSYFSQFLQASDPSLGYINATNGCPGTGCVNTAGFQNLTHLTFDSNGNLWGTDNNGFGNVYEINNSTSAGDPAALTINYDPFFVDPTSGNPPLAVYTPLAVDSVGNVYGCASGTGQSLNIFTFNTTTNTGTNTTVTTPIPTGRGCGNLMAVDGLGHIFAVTGGTSAVLDEFTPNLTASPITLTMNSPAAGFTGTSPGEGVTTINPDPLAQPADGASFFFGAGTPAPGSGMAGMAVDRSGNLWILNYDTGASTPGNVLVEYIGIAAPVLTPTAQALSFGQLGQRP